MIAEIITQLTKIVLKHEIFVVVVDVIRIMETNLSPEYIYDTEINSALFLSLITTL